MKKLLKIAGVLAVVITLVCNLQYAVFDYDNTRNPGTANAAWTDMRGTYYCGSSPYTDTRVGNWSWVANSFYSTYYGYYGYSSGFWLFTPSNYGTQCGQANPYPRDPDGSGTMYPSDPWAGHDVTNIQPTGGIY